MINDELEAELSHVRQALANSVAVEIQIKQQIQKNHEQSEGWEKRAAMSRQSNQKSCIEELASQAEERLKQCKQAANELEIQLLSQQDFTAGLKKDLAKLESRRFSTGGSGREAMAAADSTLSSIERLENKIISHESFAELGNEDADRKLAQEDANSALEEELKALKAANKKV